MKYFLGYLLLNYCAKTGSILINDSSNPPPRPPSKIPKLCALIILYREIPYMGRLGPRAVPPPRTRQGVLKKRYTITGCKKKVSTKKLGYVSRRRLT